MSKYNCSCTTNPTKVSSDNVYYAGAYLSTLDILPNEYLTSILQKINDYSFNTSGCVTCDGGIPVFTGVKNAFALATDSNGKVITATNVYNKTEVNNLISAGNTNIGNTDLTLTGNRVLNGSDTRNLSIIHINNLVLGANQFSFQSAGSNTFSYQGVNGYVYTINSNSLSGTRTYDLPNDSGTIALESYVDDEIDSNRNKPLLTDVSGNIIDNYLVNKDLVNILGAGFIFEKTIHFNKTLNSNQVIMISPNTLLPNYNYTPIFN